MTDRELFERLEAQLWASERTMPDEKYVVREETILAELPLLQDLELTDKTGMTLLDVFAVHQREQVAAYLLDRGANVNTTEKQSGFSALHFAVQSQNIPIIKALLSHGADPNLQDKYGNTPLGRIKCTGDIEMFRLLLAAGADPTIKNVAGISTLDATKAYPQVQKLLLASKFVK